MDYCDFTATSGLPTVKTNSTRFLNFQLDRFYAIRSLQWLMNIWGEWPAQSPQDFNRIPCSSLFTHFPEKESARSCLDGSFPHYFRFLGVILVFSRSERFGYL